MPKLTFVNNEPLDPGAIESEFQAIKAHYESLGSVSCCDRDDEFIGYATEHVMARVLLHQEAARQQLEVSDQEVDEALQALYDQAGGKDDFYLRAAMSPTHEPDVRLDLINSLRIEKTLRALIGEANTPSLSEIEAFYQQNLADYMTEEEASALHLYKKVDRSEERQKIYDHIRSLREQAKSGADFAELALAHTDKDDKLVDLGWFKQGEFMDEFGVIAFSLEEGEISPVFASHFGFHLAKCTGRRRPQALPFVEVQDKVQERWRQEDQQHRSHAAVARLKEQAVIDVRHVTAEEKAALGF